MRTIVSVTMTIRASRSHIWTLYADLTARCSWAPGLLDVHVVDGGPASEGARIRSRLRVMVFSPVLDETITRYEPERSYAASGRLPGWSYAIELSLADEQNFTQCTYSCTSDYWWPLRPAVPLLDRLNRQMLRDALSGLKNAAELPLPTAGSELGCGTATVKTSVQSHSFPGESRDQI